MKSATTILSSADKDEYLSDCEPGETVSITGTLGEPDANGNYPITVESITAQEAPEETPEKEPSTSDESALEPMKPPKMRPAMKAAMEE